MELLASSDLVGFTAKSAVREAAVRYGIVEIPIKGWTYTRRAGVIYRKDAYLSPAAKRFIEILKATAKESIKLS